MSAACDVKLTIAIPTYNRPTALKETLSKLLPQLQNDVYCKLIVIDNCSDIPAQQIVDELGISLPDFRFLIIRNSVNIGMGANIMRCFELCESPWLWVLSDDDNPTENAVEIILKDAKAKHSYAFYNIPVLKAQAFSGSDPDHRYGSSFISLLEYVGGRIDFQACLSASVFCMDSIRPFIKEGYLAANTGVPHLFMVYKALTRGCSWMISKETIAEYCLPEKDEAWGVMSFAFAMATLFGMARSSQEIISIRDCFVRGWRINPKNVFYYLVSRYDDRKGDRAGIRYLFNLMKAIYAPSWRDDFKIRGRWLRYSVQLFFLIKCSRWTAKKDQVKTMLNESRV